MVGVPTEIRMGISPCEQETLQPDPLAQYNRCEDPVFSFLNECGYKPFTSQKAVSLLEASKIQRCFSPCYCYFPHFSSSL